MSLYELPSEILLQIILSSGDAHSSEPSPDKYSTLIAPLRSTCRRFAHLLSTHSSYLSPLLLPVLPSPQTYETLSIYLPVRSEQVDDQTDLFNLLTQQSRLNAAQCLMERIKFAAAKEKKLANVSDTLSEYHHTMESIPLALSSIRELFTLSDILALRKCPGAYLKASEGRMQGWQTYLIQEHFRTIKTLESFDMLIAVLFALSSLITERRRSWLVSVMSFSSSGSAEKATVKSSDGKFDKSFYATASDLLHHDKCSPYLQSPSYAYISIQKFMTAELILRKGPKWVDDVCSLFEEQESEMLCRDAASSPTSSISNTVSLEDRIRDLLIPIEQISISKHIRPLRQHSSLSQQQEYFEDTPIQSEHDASNLLFSDEGLPLMKLFWKERERKLVFQSNLDRQREARERQEREQQEAEAEQQLPSLSSSTSSTPPIKTDEEELNEAPSDEMTPPSMTTTTVTPAEPSQPPDTQISETPAEAAAAAAAAEAALGNWEAMNPHLEILMLG